MCVNGCVDVLIRYLTDSQRLTIEMQTCHWLVQLYTPSRFVKHVLALVKLKIVLIRTTRHVES